LTQVKKLPQIPPLLRLTLLRVNGDYRLFNKVESERFP